MPSKRKPWQSAALVLATAGALFRPTGPTAADILVVSSSAPGLRPGMQIADSAQIEVPAGAKVRVLLPSGATLSLNGPTTRLVKDVTKGEPIVESVWAKAKELLVTGGVDQSRPGATRGITAAGPVDTPPFSWNVIGAASTGNVCVERGARLVLVRPANSKADEITLIDTSNSARAQIVWPEGSAQVDWPATLTPNAATTYQLVAKGQASRQIRLRLLGKEEMSETAALATLLANDCRQQARAWAK